MVLLQECSYDKVSYSTLSHASHAAEITQVILALQDESERGYPLKGGLWFKQVMREIASSNEGVKDQLALYGTRWQGGQHHPNPLDPCLIRVPL
jgi:hypothetical protein